MGTCYCVVDLSCASTGLVDPAKVFALKIVMYGSLCGDQGNIANIETCCRLDHLGFQPQWGQEIFFSPHPSRPAVRPT